MSVENRDAHNRAVADYAHSANYMKTAGQLVFASNGGAAVAMLSFLTQVATNQNIKPFIDTGSLIYHFVISASCYLGGLVFAIIAMFFIAISKKNHADFWEKVALGKTLSGLHPSTCKEGNASANSG